MFISVTTSRASIGSGATGGGLAAPIVKNFMKVALANKPPVPFRVPAGIKLVRVDPKTGTRVGPGGPSILEAFKPGTAPPDGYAVCRLGRGGGGGGSPMEASGRHRSALTTAAIRRRVRRGAGRTVRVFPRMAFYRRGPH